MTESGTPAAPSRDLPTLPRTWRPLGVRLAAIFFGVILLVVTVAAGLALDPEVQAKFTPFQVGTLIFLGLLVTASLAALARSKVTATETGLRVVNGFRTHHVTWSEIQGVRLPSGAPWATLHLGDDQWGADQRVQVMALQGSDGDRARAAVQDIRALWEQHRG